MRSDMAKVLVERPRTGRAWAAASKGSGTRSAQRAQERDEQPQQESVRKCRTRRGAIKDLNENLAPFWRFIDGCVGRPWAKVYAEICEHVDRSSAVQAHILQHVWDRIERNPIYRDGKVYSLPRFIGELREIDQFSYYIDRLGILRRGKGLSYRQQRALRKDSPRYVVLSPGRIAKQDESGNWYEVTLADKPHGVIVRDAWLNRDLVGESEYGWDPVVEYSGKRLYAVSKRAMNSREISRLPMRR
jgi:hypothetical protein